MVVCEKVAKPATTVQFPAPPTPAAEPFKLVVLVQRDWSEPALTVKALLVTMTSSDELQALLVMVQRKVFDPALRPVTGELGEVGVVIAPRPVTRDQRPEPMVGALPDKVAELLQTAISSPAEATVTRSLKMETSSNEVQPFWLTVQRKTFTPLDKPETVEL